MSSRGDHDDVGRDRELRALVILGYLAALLLLLLGNLRDDERPPSDDRPSVAAESERLLLEAHQRQVRLYGLGPCSDVYTFASHQPDLVEPARRALHDLIAARSALRAHVDAEPGLVHTPAIFATRIAAARGLEPYRDALAALTGGTAERYQP